MRFVVAFFLFFFCDCKRALCSFADIQLSVNVAATVDASAAVVCSHLFIKKLIMKKKKRTQCYDGLIHGAYNEDQWIAVRWILF